MNPLRVFARPLLAAGFIATGIDQWRNASSHAAGAAQAAAALPTDASAITESPERAVKVNATAMVVAGAMLARGKMPRTAALVLTGTMAAATATQYGAASSDASKQAARTSLSKNIALVGAAMLATTATSRAPERAAIARLSKKSLALATENARLRAVAAANNAAAKVAAI